MNWSVDERLFYGGIAVMAGTLLAAGIYVCISQIKKIRLNAQLDDEYGKKDI